MTTDASALLLDHGNEMLFLVAIETQRIHTANGAAARHLGYAREHFVDMPITDIECALSDACYWEEVRQGRIGELRDTESCYRRADGSQIETIKSVTRPASNPAFLAIVASLAGKRRRHEMELAETSARLRASLEATADGILFLDRTGAIVNMNRRFAALWTIPDELLLSGNDQQIFAFMLSRVVDAETYQKTLDNSLPGNDAETCDLIHLTDKRILERKSRPARQGKQIIGRVFSFSDVTEAKNSETRLKLAASVFTHAHEGILITDADGTIVEVNDALCRITGYERAEILGKNPRLLKSGLQNEAFYKSMWQALMSHGHWEGELWNRHRDGHLFAEKLSIAAVPDESGRTQHYVALLSDITELKEHQKQLERLAHYDALTGIPNRVMLFDRLRLALAQSRRHQRSLALVYLDIDGFKGVNDTFGHATGDQLLIAMSRRLSDTLRDCDTLARLGGDEFAAILTDLDDLSECHAILNRLVAAAARPITIGPNTFRLSASFGVTLSPDDTGDADTLLRHADQAMYRAKRQGKNRYCVFDPSFDG